MMSHVIHILQKCYSSHTHTAPDTILTQRFLSQGYIGLFLEEEGSEWLRKVMSAFSLEMKKHGELSYCVALFRVILQVLSWNHIVNNYTSH